MNLCFSISFIYLTFLDKSWSKLLFFIILYWDISSNLLLRYGNLIILEFLYRFIQFCSFSLIFQLKGRNFQHKCLHITSRPWLDGENIQKHKKLEEDGLRGDYWFIKLGTAMFYVLTCNFRAIYLDPCQIQSFCFTTLKL